MTLSNEATAHAAVAPVQVSAPELELVTDASLRGKNVCVVGLNYAPEPTGIAPYTAGLAEMLVEHGADVGVIAGVPHYPSWRVDPEFRHILRSRSDINGVTVRRARHFVPAHQSAMSRVLLEGSFLANAGTMRPDKRPDLVIAETPALSGAVVGARLARRFGVPFGIVVQDLLGKAARQSGIRGGASVAGAASRVESKVLRSADVVAVISDAFRDQVGEYGVDPERVQLLRNWTHIAPPHAERVAVRRELGWSHDQFVVLHTGNMGLKQDLCNVIEAARRFAGRPDVLVVLMGDGSQRAALETAAAGIQNLQIVPPVSEDRYPDVLRAADLLLVNERPSVGDMSLPSKLTSYFAAGQPVLAAVSDNGACSGELIAAKGSAVRIEPGDPDALAAAILEIATDKVRLKAMGRAGTKYAERLLARPTARRNVLALAQRLLDAQAGEPRRS